MMNARGVLVSCSMPGNNTSTHFSGILLDDTWILTTGSVLNLQVSNISSEPPWESLLKTARPGGLVRIPDKFLQSTQVKLTAMCPATSKTNNLLYNQKTTKLDATVNKTLSKYIPKHQNVQEIQNDVSIQKSFSHNYPEVIKKHTCDLRYMWKSPFVLEAVESLLSLWVLGNTSSGKEDSDTDADSEIAKRVLPVFLIIKLQSNYKAPSEREDYSAVLKLLNDLFEQEDGILRRGRMTVVESTPFGNSLFYNSVSEGIISNVVGPGNCLIITDARTALGSEGGPIYVLTERNRKTEVHLVGMVLCSLCWWRGEWVGFTLGVTLKAAVYHCIFEKLVPPHNTITTKPFSIIDKLEFLDGCMVLVRCGVTWGSGIVIDACKGIILTCSHVVRKAKYNKLQICWNNMKKPAQLLFRSRDGIAYDVAVLAVESGLPLQSVPLSSRSPVKGEPVLAAGFPLFSEDENSRPTVTRGIVAHVSNPPAMFQTTCCVQSGASGGAIFCRTGELTGLISCNTQDTTSGALFPHINMAVPICMLETQLADFIRTGDIHCLNSLESPDPAVQRIWNLQSLNSKL